MNTFSTLTIIVKKKSLNKKIITDASLCYRESLENKNVTFHDNGTMSYMPKRKVTFNREKSASDPMKDIVNVPNIPMLVSRKNIFSFLFK